MDAGNDGSTINRLGVRNPYLKNRNFNRNNFNNNKYKNFNNSCDTAVRPPIPQRSQIDTTCPAFGPYGHNATKNWCNMTAQIVEVLRFIKQKPQMLPTILSKHKEDQERRSKALRRAGGMRERFQNKVQARKYNFYLKSRP